MADSVALQILDRVLELLNDERPSGVPEFTRRRTFPGEEVRIPVAGVFLGDEALRPAIQSANEDRTARRTTVIAVQYAGATDTREEIDDLPDETLSWATAKLGARRALGTRAFTITETGTTRRVEYKNLSTIIATRLFSIDYQTRRDDATTT